MKKIIYISISLFFTILSGCSEEEKKTSVDDTVTFTKSDTVYFLGSSSIENFGTSLSLWPEKYSLNAVNLGKGGELIDSMCIRIGALSAHAKFKSKDIYKDKRNYFEGDWDLDYGLKPFKAKINNIEGIVSIDSEGYYFEPYSEGPIDPNYFYEIKSSQFFVNNPVFVVNLGKNNLLNNSHGNDSYKYVSNKSTQCIEWINHNITDRIIVMGHFSSLNPSDSLINQVKLLNQKLGNYYTSNFYDLNKYILSKTIWDDTNLIPTNMDIEAQKFGYLPFTLANDSIHLNEKANIAVTNQLYKTIKAKNWIN